jgi:hypothetical protein
MKSPGVFPEKATFLPDSAAALYGTCHSEDVKQSGWECSYLSGNTVRILGIAITFFFKSVAKYIDGRDDVRPISSPLCLNM